MRVIALGIVTSLALAGYAALTANQASAQSGTTPRIIGFDGGSGASALVMQYPNGMFRRCVFAGGWQCQTLPSLPPLK